MNYKSKYFFYILIASLLLLAIISIFTFYNYPITGFSNKKIWDWLELLIIPLAIALIGIYFTRTERETEREFNHSKLHTEINIAKDKSDELKFMDFQDKISNLVIDHKINDLDSLIPVVSTIARARIFTLSHTIDARFKGNLILFIYELGLILKDNPVVNLDDVHLANTHLFWKNLDEIDLSRALMVESDITSTSFDNAKFKVTIAADSDFRFCSFVDADLSHALLTNCNFVEANFTNAVFNNSLLYDSKFDDAILDKADLSKAHISEAQLANAKSMIDTKLPEKFAEVPYNHTLKVSNRTPNMRPPKMENVSTLDERYPKSTPGH